MKDIVSPKETRQKAIWTTISNYIEVTKPRSVFLLAFTSIAAMIVARGRNIPLNLFVQALAAIVAGCAGANAITGYIDRHIDAGMERTKRRPIPARRICPPEKALLWGLALALLSLFLAWRINLLSFGWMLLGLADNIIIYSSLTKRRSSLNIIWGGFSGGLPALFGWTAVTKTIDLVALLIGALVVLWIPNHIWNLAVFYRDDYERVGVPMLPVVIGFQKALRCIVATVMLMYALSIALYLIGGFGPIYLSVALVFGLLIVVGNLRLLFKPSPERAWRMFKLSSPYLFVLFLGMILDVLLK